MTDPNLSIEARVRALVEIAAQTDDAVVDGDVLAHLTDALALPEPKVLAVAIDNVAELVRYRDSVAADSEVDRLADDIAEGLRDLIARASA